MKLCLIFPVFDHEHHDDYHYDDFAKGWSLLGNRYQDKTDYEWNAWTKLTFTLLPWLLLNLLGAEFIRSQGWIKVLPLWYAAVTISNVTYTFNLMITLSFILQIYAFYVCVYFRNKTLVWIVSFIIRQYFKPEEWFSINEDDNYLIITSSIWMILRCVSFSLDDMETCGKDRSGRQHFVNSLTMLGYSLYLPTMFCGPFISFGQFHSGIKSNFRSWTIKRIKKIILSFARCVFWYFFTQLALHFIYVNAVLHRAHVSRYLSSFIFVGTIFNNFGFPHSSSKVCLIGNWQALGLQWDISSTSSTLCFMDCPVLGLRLRTTPHRTPLVVSQLFIFIHICGNISILVFISF